MRYLIDAQSMQGFLQFVTLPESGDTWAYPNAAQFRGGRSLLERLAALVEKAQQRIQWADDKFHDVDEARRAFECGEVLHSSGEPLLVALLQRRQMTLLAGSTILVKEVSDLQALQRAFAAALKKLKD